MAAEKICKTVHQYSSEPVSKEDMGRLQEIADDYKKVKEYVYQRYSGPGSLPKLYPGYTVQNEMTASGLREQLGMPSVYFYLAVFDALADIKSQWTRTKTAVLKRMNQNEGFTDADRHYLRFLLKVSNAFEAVLNGRPVELKKEMQRQYECVAAQADTERMNRYLCRQVRRNNVQMHVASAQGFSAAERAYRYGDHGIYISTKQKRRRVYVPLTDNNQYKRQIYIKLCPQQDSIQIRVPVDVGIRIHRDYKNQVGLALGMYTMLTTDEGHSYGTQLGIYQSEYVQWLRTQAKNYHHSPGESSGRKKYEAKKRKYEERLHSYINHELNRFLQEEMPQCIYIVKLPKSQSGGANKEINHSATLWQRGYIRRRLEQKCREHSVEIIQVIGKGISIECSRCGVVGAKADGVFSCSACGYCADEKINTACNVKKRGQGAGRLN